jgi:class 3 adenylate cyclase
MSYELYSDIDLTNYSILLKYVENFFSISGELTPEMKFTFYNFLNKSMDENYPILNINYNNSVIWENKVLINENFRYDEVNYFYHDDGIAIISYGTLFDNKLNSILNIARTVYVAIILGWMIVKLDEDSKTHALYPLENIMSIIQTISRDPIGSCKTQKLHGKSNKNFLSEVKLAHLGKKNNPEDKQAENDLDTKEVRRRKAQDKRDRNKLKSKSNFEVKTIEAAVIKISALLAIGFGEAGEAIIKHNLKHGTQEVNPMVKGRKKIAIFGFCDIRQFPIVNECLQERTMSFVNQIANIVHTSVDLFMGAANKNIGDAFLCVWKFRNCKKKQNVNNQLNSSEENINNENEDKSDSDNLNVNNNNNTFIVRKINLLKKKITNHENNAENLDKKEVSVIDFEVEEKSLNEIVENRMIMEDANNKSINKIQYTQVKQSLSDNDIKKSIIENNIIKFKDEKNNNINKNTNNKQDNKININSNKKTSTTLDNNNINYNININVLSIPNNNIKININNNNFINNTLETNTRSGYNLNSANGAQNKKGQNFTANENQPFTTEFNQANIQRSAKTLNKIEILPLTQLQDEFPSNPETKQKISKTAANAKEGINQTEAADRALLGYLHIIKCINKRPNILVYRTDADILNRIPNYKVKMGFGLHIGWAIEGAIGSHHKIDASYLSPNVNMSARLEGATKQYGVSILLSGDLYDSLSPELKEICRLIDVVTVKGSNKPIKLYTVDLNLDLTPSEKDQPNINLSENRKIYEEKKERFYEEIEFNGVSIGNHMKSKNSFRELLEVQRPSAFKEVFANAIDNYIKGDWEKARKYLNKALELSPNDGPGKTIFEYLSKYDFKASANWNGYRELSSK